jgi:hypothetical protein
MTATVNLSAITSDKQRKDFGLDLVADYVHQNRTTRVPVVGFVEYHEWKEKLNGNVMVVAMPVAEPGFEADGSDPDGVGEQLLAILDDLRRKRGKSDAKEIPLHTGELEGQQTFDFDGLDDGEPKRLGEVRLGPDGEHEVPPPSGEEILAEREEAKAAGVPEAAFSGGTE